MTGTRSDSEELAVLLDKLDYHAPLTALRKHLHERTREVFKGVTTWVFENTTPGEDQDSALKAIRLAMMWTNASLAIDGPPGELDPDQAREPGPYEMSETVDRELLQEQQMPEQITARIKYNREHPEGRKSRPEKP